VKADVFGRVVTVEGEVDGNVYAQEQAVLRQSGAVRGNITSPRVTLEDGSRFKGSIDMDSSRAGGPGAAKAGEVRPTVGATAASPANAATAATVANAG
jgi:cytoskeletal protein CcmA (bactofilin family)